MNRQPLDLDSLRSRFPGLGRGWAFFDNAGGTQIVDAAVERMTEFLYQRNVQLGGSYQVSQEAASALAEGRDAVARMINASRPEEISFQPSSTVALQNLARSMASRFRPGDEVIVTVSDHESNIGPWVGLERHGVTVRFWPVDRDSLELDLGELDRLMNDRTRLVAVTHVSNILGTINPVAEIARFVHERGALICVDSVACAPHRAIDVQALDVDFLAFSLYKTFGPHCAVLYGKFDELAELDNLYHYFYGKDRIPAKLEPGNAAYELAFAAVGVVDYLEEIGREAGATDGGHAAVEAAFDAITLHEYRIAERLLSWLRAHPDIAIVGRPRGDDPQRVPTISFTVAGRAPGAVAEAVDPYRVAIRHGDFHARRLIEYLGLADQGGVVRVSMAHYNTEAEVDRLLEALGAALGERRAAGGQTGAG